MTTRRYIRWIRLSLGGTVLGIALGQLVAGYLGYGDTSAIPTVGGFGGTAVAAVLVKLSHIV